MSCIRIAILWPSRCHQGKKACRMRKNNVLKIQHTRNENDKKFPKEDVQIPNCMQNSGEFAFGRSDVAILIMSIA